MRDAGVRVEMRERRLSEEAARAMKTPLVAERFAVDDAEPIGSGCYIAAY